MALWVTANPVELRPNSTESDLQSVIRAVYRQVLGNQHVLETDRLVDAESMLRNNDISVRRFVTMVAKSDLYRSLFFHSSSPYRFIELNCKHLLGRPPIDQAEIAQHVQTYNTLGYEAEIESYVDSEEYLDNFGENIVPYPRSSESQLGFKNSTFTRGFALMRGEAATDRSGQAKLISAVASNLPTAVSSPAVGNGANYSSNGKRFRLSVSNSSASARLNKYSQQKYVVSFDQLSQQVQHIHKTGGKILSIAEIA